MVEGSFSVLPCTRENATPFVEDPRIKMVTFTGSPPVGWDIKRRAGKKRVTLELGGNAAVIIEPDADMEYAVKRIVFGAFAYSGQICISVQRTYIHESCYSSVLEALVRETEKLVRRLLADQPGKKKKPAAQSANADIRRLELDISEKLGAKVHIQHSSNGAGKIIVNYHSLDELDGILKHIK